MLRAFAIVGITCVHGRMITPAVMQPDHDPMAPAVDDHDEKVDGKDLAAAANVLLEKMQLHVPFLEGEYEVMKEAYMSGNADYDKTLADMETAFETKKKALAKKYPKEAAEIEKLEGTLALNTLEAKLRIVETSK